MISVVVADDETLFRDGLTMIIDSEEDLQVVGVVGDGRSALDVVRARRPDVALLDIQMPVMNGIAATAEMARLDLPTRSLVLTTFGMDRNVTDALRAGASGFLLKTVPAPQLVAGIRTVAAGEALLSPQITRRLIEEWVRRPTDGAADPRLAGLTARELEVLALVGRGLSNTEVAAELFLGEATVKTHLGRVLTKTGTRDRIQAVVLAYETGLVVPGAG